MRVPPITIRRKVQIAAAVVLLITVFVILVAAFTSRQVLRALHQADAAQEIAHAVAELSLLTDAYLAYGEARMETQWRSRAGTIQSLLDQHRSPPAGIDLQLVFDSLTRSFSALEEINREKNLPDSTDGDTAALSRIAERIGSRMRMDSQQLLSGTFSVARAARGHAVTIQKRGFLVVAGAAAILILTILGTVTTLSLTVTRRMQHLLKGVRALGDGLLDQRIRSDTNDEIGIVADAFNTMASRLEQLVWREQKAQEELRTLNTQLEARVEERTEALAAANREMEAFTYSVSHDLRAPLRAVDGFTRFLQEDYGPHLDQEAQRFLDVIRGNVQQMDKLITDLLALSRVTRSDLKSTAIEMEPLVHAIWRETVPEETRRAYTFTVKNMPPAQGDPSLLKQVWVNLVSNAVKYSSTSPRKEIEVGGVAENGEAVYYIRDYGVGFDPAYGHKVFGAFQRLHRSDQFEGTGIGLAIVERIVLRHGGRVWAEGEEDKGATFHFAVPAAPGNEGGRTGEK